ncbi:MAG: TRAP transporter small permease subunit [Pseudomonadota bacterium]|nr:TRAP transporter small permease subunit [Pseudomonadota bacterium]MEC8267007.1 TRAP transporter small permease subunit [Pseudomonadota bacterium]MEC8438840.1 TRAP transporter small permease subunit [Pseudomonadota bacterium]MEC8526582.1 TRAP transporter small permease subunit [Pseudomonadota bacterium]MEC8528475.1 TRAP transporter small permease subunit [Pseudomonadota bacterium]
MKYWATLAQTIDSVSRSVGNAVAFAAIAMALVTTTVVILRYGFGQGAIAAQESVLYLHGALFMLGAAPTLLTDKHVRVDVFYRNFTDRQKHWVNTIGHTVFTLPFCTLIVFGSWGYVSESWSIMESSPEPGGIPAVFLLKTLIPAMALLLALQAVSLIIQGLIELSEVPTDG